MTALRQSAATLRWVLACFLLTLGAAVAGPVAGLQSLEVVCSAKAGMKLLVKDSDGEVVSSHSVLDCPLCQPLGAPPPQVQAQPSALPQACGLPSPGTGVQARSRAAPPLPARGPPDVVVLS